MQAVMYFAEIPRILLPFLKRLSQLRSRLIIILMVLSCVIDSRVIKEFLNLRYKLYGISLLGPIR